MTARFRPGDVVVYRKQKFSVHPGPHARDVQPSEHGDSYSYSVIKYWRVVAVLPEGTLVVHTHRGKQLTVAAGDPNLRGRPLTVQRYEVQTKSRRRCRVGGTRQGGKHRDGRRTGRAGHSTG